MRESIVNKINSKGEIFLNKGEIDYIVRNWVELHSQHKVDTFHGIRHDYPVIAIKLDKDSIFKSHV
jgi:hypothetical protein